MIQSKHQLTGFSIYFYLPFELKQDLLKKNGLLKNCLKFACLLKNETLTDFQIFLDRKIKYMIISIDFLKLFRKF